MARVMGLETEYGMAVQPARALERTYEITRALVDVPGMTARTGFLANGARLYADCGHVEYATPECTDPLTTVTCDRAGEHVVAALAGRTPDRLALLGVDEVRHLKHNVDSVGNGFGCHENYRVTASVSRHHVAEQLAAFLLTRCCWAGAGRVVGGRFRTSQRAGVIERVVGYNSTTERPLMNLRDEALADAGKWQRVHLLAGDANLCDVPAVAKLAATSLVLRCIEAGDVADRLLEPVDVAEVHMAVATSLDGRDPLSWKGNRTATALEVQFHWLEQAAALLERDGGEPWEHAGLGLWRRMLELLEARGVDGLVGLADWATKYSLLDSVAAASPAGWDDVKVSYVDMLWHDLDVGYARRLEAAGAVERLTDPAEVERAVGEVPVGACGRARARARFLELVEAAGLDAGANWERVWLHQRHPLVLQDPEFDARQQVESWLRGQVAQVPVPPGPEGAHAGAVLPGA